MNSGKKQRETLRKMIMKIGLVECSRFKHKAGKKRKIWWLTIVRAPASARMMHF
jgi:hypothetical protein